MLVLLVEDDPVMVKIVVQMLRADGHTCHSTTSGERAVALSRSNDYDVILLDVMLPDTDGYEVTKLLREDGVRTPVVLQSGLVDLESGSGEPGFGVENYLTKPFNKRQLIDCLETAVSRADQVGDPDEAAGTDMPQAAQIVESERREDRRMTSLKSAKIAYGSGIDCIVLNLSRSGASIQLPQEDVVCPPRFALRFRTGTVHRCEQRWRCRDKVGVRFV